jgi:hypothetical protein
MINLKTDEYRQLISVMYATENLIKYINTDVLKHNDLKAIDLKYLNRRMNRVTELITRIETHEK